MGASGVVKCLSRLSIAKSALVWVRFVFMGMNEQGAVRTFFVELQGVNADASQNDAVLGYKSVAHITPDDLQSALAMTSSVASIGVEDAPVPSYVAVRAGMLGLGAKQVAVYDGAGHLSTSKEQFASVAGCTFTDDTLKGSISLTEPELLVHPEYMCQSGEVQWDMRFKVDVPFHSLYKRSSSRWCPLGAKASFSGNIVFDGQKYEVSATKSYGYIDFTECRKSVLPHTLPIPHFHISSSFLTSHITGKVMESSAVVVHGMYGVNTDNVAIGLKLGDKTIAVPAMKSGIRTIAECVEAAADEDGQRLHWSMSVDLKHVMPYGNYVIDVDVMCHTQLLSVRNIELPEGKRHVMRLLAGGDGEGSVRLFQHVKKDLVLIEEARMASALCEFGQLDGGTE